MKLTAIIMLLLMWCLPWQGARAADEAAPGDSVSVMDAFTKPLEKRAEQSPEEQSRHQILFIMGAALLALLLITATLGIAMVVYGKQVFVPHMIFAGLTVSLAIAHSVAAIVWFFPY